MYHLLHIYHKQRVEYGAQCFIINSSNIDSFNFEASNFHFDELGINLLLTSCGFLGPIDQFVCGKYAVDDTSREISIYRNYP